jgi:hypothetical protein
MKKLTVLLIIAFAMVLTVSSCNKKDCPAYSRAGSEQTGRNV